MDEDGKRLIIFHGKCNDGFCAAWVAHMVFPNAQFFAANHGQLPPDVSDKQVFLLDFCYPREILLGIKAKAKSLLVIDHHKSTVDRAKGIDCVFNVRKSGGRLAWDYFGKGEAPWLVNYTEDRDLKRWALPHTHEVNAALSSYPMDFKVWDHLSHLVGFLDLCSSRCPLVQDGAAIARFRDQQIRNIATQAREVDMDGYKVLAANTSVDFCDVAEHLSEHRPFGIAWYLRSDGKYIYSLQSKESAVDVSVIAERHGGGGHPHSAGFEAKELVFNHV